MVWENQFYTYVSISIYKFKQAVQFRNILEIYPKEPPKVETGSYNNLLGIVITTLVFHAGEHELEDLGRTV